MSKVADVDVTYDHNGQPLYDFVEPTRREVIMPLGGVSLTRQEFKEECDVNTIMAHYEKTAVMPPSMWNGPPEFLDVSNVPDLASAMDLMKRAEVAFMTLPPQVRLSFDNDPVAFVAFAENPANVEQMRDWKLAPEAPVVAAPSSSSSVQRDDAGSVGRTGGRSSTGGGTDPS